MNAYTKVVLEVDAKQRIIISRLDDEDLGIGHRFCGPMLRMGADDPVKISHTLDADDGFELALCVRTLDGIHSPDLPPEWDALALAQNLLRATLVSLDRCEQAEAHDAVASWRQKAIEQRAKVAQAATALAVALA